MWTSKSHSLHKQYQTFHRTTALNADDIAIMATTSFDKSFVVVDQDSIKKLTLDANNPRVVTIKKRDYLSEKEEGVQLLKQKLSSLKT